MRVLFLTRASLDRYRGGDTTQIESTARELRALGATVEVVSELPADVTGWDLVHLFHLDRLWENLPQARAVAGRIPTVLSMIWWPKEQYNVHSRPGIQGALARTVGERGYDSLRLVQRSVIAFAGHPSRRTLPRPSVWSFDRSVRALLSLTQLVLPNSEAEQRELERRFQITVPYRVIPNGFELEGDSPESTDPPPDVPRDVICVGRFEPRKNQHLLIEAIRGTGLRLAFAGASGQFSAAYERKLRAAAGPGVEFLGFLPQPALRSLYRSARVHVLPSWFETPGLASLEAAAHGCPIVVGDAAPVREYFGDLATYCEPGDVDSIRAAILHALDHPHTEELQRRVAERFTWPKAAAETMAAYEDALARWRTR